MATLWDTLKDTIYERLVALRLRVEDAKPRSLYTAMCMASVWPLLQAAQDQGIVPVAMALGSVAAGVGGNLLAEQLQRWRDQAEPVSEDQATAWLSTQAQTNTELRDALDSILEYCKAIPTLQAGLPQKQQQQLRAALREELRALGNLKRFQVHLRGSGAVAQGKRSAAASHGGQAISGTVYGAVLGPGAQQIIQQGGPLPPAELREAYLSWVMEQVHAVPLVGVDPGSVSDDTRRDLDLAAVYTALMTQSTAAPGKRQVLPAEHEVKRLSALAMLNLRPRLTLLGDPGSGKSTFVNFVALCLAGETLGHAVANLTVLRAPLPTQDDEKRPRQQPWRHGALLPLRVILREFVARGLPPLGQPVPPERDLLWSYIASGLPELLHDFVAPLRQELLQSGGLLLLDGLDEVPEADQRRLQVKQAVAQFIALFRKVRVLATSRTYAYQKQDWKLDGFAEAVLAPFEARHIRRFVERWYAYVGLLRGLPETDTQGRAVRLNDSITHNPRLAELASRPLLLTLMASLHAWHGGTLPEQREQLYDRAVELLLNHWENEKTHLQNDGSYAVVQPSLVEWLHTDQKAMRQTLNRLAFEAHRDQPALVGTADIAESILVDALLHMGPHQHPDMRMGRLIEYLRDRAGILEPRGVGVYAFPHRTFQEYLAACHLTDVGFIDVLPALVRADPSRWREVTLLAGAKAARGTGYAAWTLADALSFRAEPASQAVAEPEAWGALLATQVLIETDCLSQVLPLHRPRVEHLRHLLLQTLVQQVLPPVDRTHAGDALATLGDPRFRPDWWFLPDDEQLGFIEIPAGSFWMGSTRDDPMAYDDEYEQHEVELPRYYMARYPVTVAQFEAFVEDRGRHWEYREYQGAPNHPVVSVSWHDAIAYCDWLTARLRACLESLPEALREGLAGRQWQVTLPSEAEWEKAARGSDARRYPWGDAADASLANYDDTGIGRTCAVGSFPGGKSPYGIEDMSGNVWEGTWSLSADYPYPAEGVERARQENLPADGPVLRVLRGGAFWDDHRGVRCACRGPFVPRFVNNLVGFRLVLAVHP